jgi:hypothetical protein
MSVRGQYNRLTDGGDGASLKRRLLEFISVRFSVGSRATLRKRLGQLQIPKTLSGIGSVIPRVVAYRLQQLLYCVLSIYGDRGR